MRASSSPASTANVTSRAATTPPNDLHEPFDRRAGSCRGPRARPAAASRRPSRARSSIAPPTMPRGNASTMAMMAEAEQQPPLIGQRHDEGRGWHGSTAAPTSGPITVCTPPSRSHDQEVDRHRDARSASGRSSPWRRRKAAGEARRCAGDGEGQPAVRAHVDADGVGAQLRIARGAQRVAERRIDAAPQQQRWPRR